MSPVSDLEGVGLFKMEALGYFEHKALLRILLLNLVRILMLNFLLPTMPVLLVRLLFSVEACLFFPYIGRHKGKGMSFLFPTGTRGGEQDEVVVVLVVPGKRNIGREVINHENRSRILL